VSRKPFKANVSGVTARIALTRNKDGACRVHEFDPSPFADAAIVLRCVSLRDESGLRKLNPSCPLVIVNGSFSSHV
jgi:hypothetical protein